MSWNNLQKNYVKNDILSDSKLRQELHTLKLKSEDDPTDYFDKVVTISMQASKITDNTISEI